ASFDTPAPLRRARRSRRVAVRLGLVAAALVAVGAGARAGEDRPDSPAVVAEGVTAGGVDLSGLTAAAAGNALETFFSRPVQLRHNGNTWRFSPHTLGARARVVAAVRAALAAQEDSNLPLEVHVDGTVLRRWARAFAGALDRRPRAAGVVLRGLRPSAMSARRGRRLLTGWARSRITTALRANEREPIELLVQTTYPRVARSVTRLAIVVRGESNRLFLYRGMTRKGMRFVRAFDVATGQPAYPTPLGRFTLATKQRDPWWYPPDSDWAAGAVPVPPGPGNPLGTRWMGLSEPLVGIHGTPDAASIGYSASHGCIRMRIADAEWLFERVRIGTPVFTVRA
ncbi:MAG: L,D-transpeptidase, partial [Gaiellaceae bacterium]